MKKFNTFEEWAAAQPAPLVDESSDPEAQIPDPVTAWRCDAEEREQQRSVALDDGGGSSNVKFVTKDDTKSG